MGDMAQRCSPVRRPDFHAMTATSSAARVRALRYATLPKPLGAVRLFCVERQRRQDGLDALWGRPYHWRHCCARQDRGALPASGGPWET